MGGNHITTDKIKKDQWVVKKSSQRKEKLNAQKKEQKCSLHIPLAPGSRSCLKFSTEDRVSLAAHLIPQFTHKAKGISSLGFGLQLNHVNALSTRAHATLFGNRATFILLMHGDSNTSAGNTLE